MFAVNTASASNSSDSSLSLPTETGARPAAPSLSWVRAALPALALAGLPLTGPYGVSEGCLPVSATAAASSVFLVGSLSSPPPDGEIPTAAPNSPDAPVSREDEPEGRPVALPSHVLESGRQVRLAWSWASLSSCCSPPTSRRVVLGCFRWVPRGDLSCCPRHVARGNKRQDEEQVSPLSRLLARRLCFRRALVWAPHACRAPVLPETLARALWLAPGAQRHRGTAECPQPPRLLERASQHLPGHEQVFHWRKRTEEGPSHFKPANNTGKQAAQEDGDGADETGGASRSGRRDDKSPAFLLSEWS